MPRPSRSDILARVRLIQDQVDVLLTDDEVKGILCSILDLEEAHQEHWEALAMNFAARAMAEREPKTK